DSKYSTKVTEGQFVGFEERLLGGSMVRTMEGSAAGHTAHREHLQQRRLAAQLCPRFIPVDLAFLARFVVLRHAGRTRCPSQLSFTFAHVLPNGCFSYCLIRLLSQYPAPDPMRGVALLAWRRTIGFQDSVDEWNQRPEHRLFAFGPLTLGWLCVRECLSHQ